MGKLVVVGLPVGVAFAIGLVFFGPRKATPEEVVPAVMSISLLVAIAGLRVLHEVRWSEEKLARIVRWSLWTTGALALLIPLFTARETERLRKAEAARIARNEAWELTAQPCALGVGAGPRVDRGLVGRWASLDGGQPLTLELENDVYWISVDGQPGKRVVLLGNLGDRAVLNLDARASSDDGERWTWLWARRDGDAMQLEGLRPFGTPPKRTDRWCEALAAAQDALQGSGWPRRYQRAP
jgi:hypothetical protein